MLVLSIARDELIEQVKHSPNQSSPAINLRLSSMVNKIIQTSQTGFMKGQFIGDSGLFTFCFNKQRLESTLGASVAAFGFQEPVNSFFSPTVNQQHGLRQGDPLLPMPFNFALEPLLLAVDQDNRMVRYRFFNSGVEHRVKASAYADDICILLDNGSDDAKLQHQLSQYSVVSTAEFDQEKTKALAMSGRIEDS
ncbi:hypothetical protein G6F46_008342 [Rhizopus delemar]|uniref:Reverse transcriptase domain-containing protein n=2 Tax=Rhizopus TaxID=4842 RepID=A0A9P7CQA8_9FUNG|nr:hypothetical protein G6F55_008648 [Rhizopus delemar]KAG1538407.1 hypothetical protein G6F51_009789 [Rhizopus arrhizus]KAG1494484.1 hypothetical protein G6F54_007842 [Rhizopus delemar]KAG1508539.1 hypothetical protein G6F53_008119 [Rhizopus delemar]KAG1522278.1 hypothetical protein G6F52_006002 [Rhizopus delemar]